MGQKINNIIDFNNLSGGNKIFWLLDPRNLLYGGVDTIRNNLPSDIANNKYQKFDYTPDKLVDIHYNAWWVTNQNNYFEINKTFHDGEFSLPEQKENDFQQIMTDWENCVMHEKKIMNLKDKFVYVHSLRSYHNDILGKLAFYFFVSLIMRKKNIIDITGKGMSSVCINPIVVILMQDSGTGKDESMNMLLDTNEHYNKLVGVEDAITNRQFEAGTTVETLHNRPKFDKNKNVVEEDEIKGLIERYDWFYSSECSHLFQKKQTGTSCLEFFLKAWQWDPIKKTLIGWNGVETETIPKATFWGVSRPVDSVRDVITDSGLLQRTFFVPRQIDKEIKIKMLNSYAKSILEEDVNVEYINKVREIAADFVELFKEKIKKKFTYDPEDKKQIDDLIINYGEQKINFISSQIARAQVSKSVNTFISRSIKHIMRLAQICAFYKNRCVIKLEDVVEAVQFFDVIYDYLVPWLETTLVEDEPVRKKRTDLVRFIIGAFKKKEYISQVALRRYIEIKSGVGETAAYIKIKELVGKVGSNKLLYHYGNTKNKFVINPDYIENK